MMKSMCVLARRADFSREQFQAYYEDHHAPLGVQHFPFARYVRNHLLDAPEIGFDTISEFWAEDISALGALMEGPVGELLGEDERRFMDQSKIAPAGSAEQVLSSGVVDGERYAVLINWPGSNPPAFLAQWAAKVASRVAGVSLDITTPWRQPAFPAQAILWAPNKFVLADIPKDFAARIIRVRRIETNPQVLTQAYLS